MHRRILQDVSPADPTFAPAPYAHTFIPSLSAGQAILYALVVTAVILMALCLMVRALVLRVIGRLPHSHQLAAQQAAFRADQTWPLRPALQPGLHPVRLPPFDL